MGWLAGTLSALSRLFGKRALYHGLRPEQLYSSLPVATGVRVNEWTAMNLAAWWAATRIISEAVASVPLIVYKKLPGGGKERIEKHPLWKLLHDQPNPEMTSMVWRETVQAHVLSWGNGLSEIVRDGAGRPTSLWPLDPAQVFARRLPGGEVVYESINYQGKSSQLTANDVLHVPGLGYDGLWGYSVVFMARESIGLGLATERFGAAWFGSGARPGGILHHPAKLSETARKNLRETWQAQTAGTTGWHGTAVLEEGMEWKQMAIPPEDSQFLQTREFQKEEIALWFNLPPMKLGSAKSATYASSEQFAVDFVVHSLRPWWVRWEQEIARKLLLPSEQGTLCVEHLADALLRGDAESRTCALQVQFFHGALTLDEWRAIENRNPLPDGQGEVAFVPMNIQPVEVAIAPPQPVPPPPGLPPREPPPSPQPEPAPAPPPPPPPANGQDKSARLWKAEQDVWRDAVARVVSREAREARHAASKPDSFLSWLDRFYADLESDLRRALLPAASLRTALGEGDPVEVAIAAAKSHCETSRQALLEVAGASKADELAAAVAACVGFWEQERGFCPKEADNGNAAG